MRVAINATADIVPVRAGDEVRIAAERDSRGLRRLRLDLSARTGDTHCLVALPSLPAEFASGPARVSMNARYEDGAGAGRTGFVLYVVGFAAGRQVFAHQLRFFAGPDAEQRIIDIPSLSGADAYELVVYADRRYRGVLELGDVHVVAGQRRYWIGEAAHIAEAVSTERAWYQDGQRIVCASPFGEHWAEMPDDWRLDRVHYAALAAADWILYAPLMELAFGIAEPPPDPEPSARRSMGRHTLLSYSAGTDSTAAMTLLPDSSFRYYCQRAFDRYLLGSGAEVQLPDASPWQARLARVENLTVVPNTFELARIAAGGRLGFGHNFGYAAIGLLLADRLEVGALAFGSVMEQVFLRLGHLFTDVVAHPRSTYHALRRLLDGAGLSLALPTAGCSEVLTMRISEIGRYAGLALSCPSTRADGSPCGTCFKCFRKLRLQGMADAPDPSEAVQRVLGQYPLKSATSVVYAAQRSGYRHPALDAYRGVDLGFLERYFDYAIEHMLPSGLAAHARGELAHLGVERMNDEDEWRLRTIGQVFWPESFNWARAGLTDPSAA